MKKSIQAVALLVCYGVSSLAFASPDPDDVLALAVDAGNWLASRAMPQESGVAWPANALQAEEVSFDLGSGTAGVVVYLLALHRATGDDHYLDLAEAGGDYLRSLVRRPGAFGEGSRRASLYAGLAGVGVALARLADVNPDYAAAAEEAVNLLVDWSVDESNGARWSDEFNDLLYGDAGTVLFMADYAGRTGDESAQQQAVAGAYYLASQGLAANEGRDPDLRLIRDGEEIRLRDWASEIIDSVRAIAEIIDRGERGDAYTQAIDAQKALIDDAEATPSARVIQDMRDNGTGFYHFAMAMAQGHKEYFAALTALEDERLRLYTEEATASLRRQKEIEDADDISFDEYIERYYSDQGCSD